MKTLLFILALQVFTLKSFCQDSIQGKHDLGLNLISLNGSSSIFYNIPDKPKFEYFTGMFYRYTQKRMAYRVGVNYLESFTEIDPQETCFDCPNGTSKNKDFQIKAGVQYYLTKHNTLLFLLTDLYYRNLFSKGDIDGGLPGFNATYTNSTNGIGLNIGLGSKITLLKRINLNPEFFYNYITTSSIINETERNDKVTTRFSYRLNNLNLNARLLLTVKF